MNEAVVGYRELIGELRRLCAEGRTGTVFITTTDNHSVRVVLRAGAIVAVMFGLQKGMAAVAAISRLTGGRLRYSGELAPHAPQDDLPPTPEVLDLLGSDVDTAETAAAAGAAGASLNGTRAILEEELVEFLGPMARLVCREHVERAARRGATSVNELIEGLARELGDAGKAARFTARVRARLAAARRGATEDSGSHSP